MKKNIRENIEKEDITTSSLLSKYDLFDKKTKILVMHMNIETLPIDRVMRICHFDATVSEDEMARLLYSAIGSCEFGTEGYDDELYTTFSAAGIRYKEQVAHYSARNNSRKPSGYPLFDSDYSRMLDQFIDGCVFDMDSAPKVFVK